MQAAHVTGLQRHFVPLSTGVTLHFAERPGNGTPVILMHGIWDDWSYWLPLTGDGPGTYDGRPLYLFDLRGHGDSSKPADGYSLADYAGDITGFIVKRGFEKVILHGHSLGTLVGLLVAAGMPERIEAMVLEDPPIPLRESRTDAFTALIEMKQQSLAAVTDDFMAWRPGTSREQAEASARRLRNTADGVLIEITRRDASAQPVPVPSVTINAPTLVIAAGDAEQRAFGDDGPELLASVLPDLRIEEIAGAGHNVLREAPGPYRELLEAFTSERLTS